MRVIRTREQELESQIKQCYSELEGLQRRKQAPGADLCNAQQESIGGTSAAYGIRAETPEETIDYLFTFHDDPDKTPHYVEIREAAKQFAKVLIRHCPSCSDRTTAIRKVRESVMTANAAVALSGHGL